MSNFLQNLVARSQGTVDPVQPLAVPRFARLPVPELSDLSLIPAAVPAPPATTDTEAVRAISPPLPGALSPAPSPAQVPPGAPPTPLPISPSVAPIPAPPPASASPTLPPATAPSPVSLAPRPTPLSVTSPPVTPIVTATERMVQWLQTETVELVQTPAPAIAIPGPPGQDGVATQVEVIRPAESTTPPPPRLPESLAAESFVPTAPSAIAPMPPPPLVSPPPPAPTVQITIGRLEVRAVPPSAPAAPPRSRPQPLRRPAVSLDQYLQQRNGRS